jgi:hypothetical protein
MIMSLDSKGFFRGFGLPGLIALLALSACAPRIYVEQDKNAALQGYHSYAWVSPPQGPVKDPILDSQILEGRVKKAVEEELANRGFKEVAADQGPDFLVTYHTSSKEKVESSGASFSFGIVDAFPNGFGSVLVPVAPDVRSREEGTFMLDVIDGKSKRLVWRGWTTGWVSQESYTDEAVAAAVQQILDKFPAH